MYRKTIFTVSSIVNKLQESLLWSGVKYKYRKLKKIGCYIIHPNVDVATRTQYSVSIYVCCDLSRIHTHTHTQASMYAYHRV